MPRCQEKMEDWRRENSRRGQGFLSLMNWLCLLRSSFWFSARIIVMEIVNSCILSLSCSCFFPYKNPSLPLGRGQQKDQSENLCELEGEEFEVTVEKWGRVIKVFEEKIHKGKLEKGLRENSKLRSEKQDVMASIQSSSYGNLI